MAGRAAPAGGALLCALLWAAAGDSPAPGAFGHVYRGAVNISAERVYAFAYRSQPGQVGASPAAPGSPRPPGSGACPSQGGAGAAVRERAGLSAVLPASSRRRSAPAGVFPPSPGLRAGRVPVPQELRAGQVVWCPPLPKGISRSSSSRMRWKSGRE